MRIAHCSDIDVPLYVSAHQTEDDCPRRVWPHEIAWFPSTGYQKTPPVESRKRTRNVIVSSDESDSEENTGRKIFTKKQLPRSTQLRATLDSLDRYHLKKKQVGPGQYPRVQGIQESERDLSSLPLWMQADRFHPL